MLEGNYPPKKGKLGKEDKNRQEAEEFTETRKQHPTVESAINGLNHKGCDKVRVHGKDGFARSVALSVLATNIHRLGVLVRNREREKGGTQTGFCGGCLSGFGVERVSW